MEYNLGIAGGTFDYLHKGHKAFLHFIFHHAKKAIIGVTSDTYVKDVKQHIHQPYAIRVQNLQNFLLQEGLLERTQIVRIDDVYGVSLDDLPIDCLFATAETEKGAEEINRKRKEKKLSQLPIVYVPLLKDEKNNMFSSTRIREGSIDQNGNAWIKEEWKTQTLMLPKDMRIVLQKPFGSLVAGFPSGLDGQKVITVGDETTKKANMLHVEQKLSIVDFVVERHKRYDSLSQLGFEKDIQIHTLSNPASCVSKDSWKSIAYALDFEKRVVITVSGEEDLLVLPCILLAPLGFHLFYGQPKEGIVHINIDIKVKEIAMNLLNHFSVGKIS